MSVQPTLRRTERLQKSCSFGLRSFCRLCRLLLIRNKRHENLCKHARVLNIKRLHTLGASTWVRVVDRRSCGYRPCSRKVLRATSRVKACCGSAVSRTEAEFVHTIHCCAAYLSFIRTYLHTYIHTNVHT